MNNKKEAILQSVRDFVKEKQENICYCPFNNIVEVLQYLSNL